MLEGRLNHACVLAAAMVAISGCTLSSNDTRLLKCSAPTETGAPIDLRLSDEGYDLAHDRRQPNTCAFDPGDDTATTIGPEVPRPPTNLRVVVVMLENRSFDHYLSGVTGTDYSTDNTNPNPNAEGLTSRQYHSSDYCIPDTPHEWGAAHLQYDNGLLDGFVATANPSGERSMAYYTSDDLPFTHWLARNFALGDRHFSSLLGPTWPNRLFLFKGTTCGYTLGALDGNVGITTDCALRGDNLLRSLERNGLRHKLYDASGPASVTLGLGLDVPESIEQFELDAKNDALPEFSMVGASTGELHSRLGIGEAENDDHPPSDVRLGELFLYRVVAALLVNPATFKRTVLFITFDENGGFYDHVPPPRACEPERNSAVRHDFAFDRYGFRVPLIVVSPFVRQRGYVSKHVTDHTSIARFVEHVWGLGALSRRDANAWPLLDFFDFGQSPELPQLDPPPIIDGGCQHGP